MPVSSPAPLSSRSQSSHAHTPMTYEKFRPKFPLDPFAAVDQAYDTPAPARAPWTLDVDALPLPSILQHEQRVILIIGQPTAASLAPLFASAQLAYSLLIIAGHRPPALPFETYPSVYTLRLRAPLAVADAGATRLIGVLEWALQVAKLWRTSGGPKKQELMEEVSPGSQSVPIGQTFGRLRYSAMPESQQDYPSSSALSPAASMTSLAPSTARRSSRFSLFRRQSTLSLVPDPANARPFDALLHFLPADAPEKARLKAMILVTTLTRPYLAVPPIRARSARFYSDSNMRSSKSGKRWSFFRSSSNLSTSTTTLGANLSRSTLDLNEGSRTAHSSLTNLALLRARRSRLLHLMPSAPATLRPPYSGSSRLLASYPTAAQTQAHLIRSIEAFLLSFCFSVSPELPTPIAGFASIDGECPKARPYVLPAMALGDVLQVEIDDDEEEEEKEDGDAGKKRRTEWTLADLILSGALESEAEPARLSGSLRSGNDIRLIPSEGGKGKEREVDEKVKVTNSEWTIYRAWIGSVREIAVVQGASKEMEEAHTTPLRSASQPLLPSQANSQSYSPPSQGSSRPHAESFQSRHTLHPTSGQLQTNRSQDQPYFSRQTGSNPAANATSKLYVDTRRRSKKTGYQSLAIEKRLPTPPEDENEELEGMEILEASSTISNATSCTRSPIDDGESAEGGLVGTSRAGAGDYGLVEVPYRRSSERTGPRDGLRQQLDSHSRLSQPSSSQSYYQVVASPPASPSSISTARDNSSRHHSSRHQNQYAEERSSPRRHEEYEMEVVPGRDGRYDGIDAQQQQCLANGSLPTPPDSERASFEGVVYDAVSPSSASDSRPRESERVGDSNVPLPRSERDRGREERKRDRVKDAQKYEGENVRQRDRERRRRSYSQPSRPEPALVVDDLTPPRRAKTKPNECGSSRDRERDRVASERRTSDVGDLLKKPLRPDSKRNPASSSEERDRGERRQSKLEKTRNRPDMKRDGSSSTEERERRRGGNSSGVKRVPVPAIEDVLPTLPRESRMSRSKMAQANSQPNSRTGGLSSSKAKGLGAGTGPSQRGGKERDHAKWKFWKDGAKSVLHV